MDNNKFSFGDTSSFAIQGEICTDIVYSNYHFGKINMICGGDILGNYGTVVLDVAANALKKKILRRDKELAGNLFAKEKDEAFNYIENVLENSDSQSEWNMYYSMYLESNVAEAFDGETVIWLTDSRHDRLIWQKFECTEIKEIYIEHGIVEKAVNEFYEFVMNL